MATPRSVEKMKSHQILFFILFVCFFIVFVFLVELKYKIQERLRLIFVSKESKKIIKEYSLDSKNRI